MMLLLPCTPRWPPWPASSAAVSTPDKEMTMRDDTPTHAFIQAQERHLKRPKALLRARADWVQIACAVC